MELNYIILAHRNPTQLHQLVRSLDGDNVNFYVHIDKNYDISLFRNELSLFHNVILLEAEEREFCAWGNFSIVKATINAINKIVTDKRTGYVVLLSGQCFPIKSKQFINNFFEENNGTNFIKGSELPNKWPGGGLNRFYDYTFFKSARKGDFIVVPPIFSNRVKNFPVKKLIRKPLFVFLILKNILLLISKRRLPFHLKPYGGSQWWAFPIDTIHFIADYINQNPKIIDFFKYSLAPDEIFFQTLVMNNKEKLDNPSFQNTLTYDNWQYSGKSNSPVLLNNADIELLKDVPYLFARKFDTDINPSVLEEITNRLL